ncbi:vitamin K epoxide reductase family protein [bacterium]|nr:vitamin K epoxide reductase family protein [bacterium]
MRTWRVAVIEAVLVILPLIGLADSLFLHVQEGRGTIGQFCEAVAGDFGSKCEDVLQSRYSEMGGVKLTIWGMLFYVSLIWIAVWARVEGDPWGGSAARATLAAVSACGFFGSMYMTYLQAVVIKAWCPFCILSAGITTLTAVLALINIRLSRPAPGPVAAAGDAPRSSTSLVSGLILLCVLLGGGLTASLIHKKQQEPGRPALETSLPYIPRRIVQPGGLIYGYDTAPVTVQAFLDYTCPHCRTFETQTFPKIKSRFVDAGRIRWISKLLPHANRGAALFFGLAGVCARGLPEAADIDRAFFAYPIPSPKTGLDAVADAIAAAGISSVVADTVISCMRTREMEMKSQLVREVNDGLSFGLKGPPAFVIDGIAYQGALDYRTMADLLETFERQYGK